MKPETTRCACIASSTYGTDDPAIRRCDLCGGIVPTDPETGEYEDAKPEAPQSTGKLAHWASVRTEGKGLEAAWAESERLCREMKVGELKAMWDSDWPLNDVLGGVYLEHVHAELNRRGEGRYCAV